MYFSSILQFHFSFSQAPALRKAFLKLIQFTVQKKPLHFCFSVCFFCTVLLQGNCIELAHSEVQNWCNTCSSSSMWSKGGRKNEERERGMPPSYIGWDEQRNLLTLSQATFFLKLCRSHVRHTKWKLNTASYQNLHCTIPKRGRKG